MAESKPLDPDEECGVCGTTREQHGDKNHKFSVDGVLEPLDPKPVPRALPPGVRGGVDPSTRVVLRLVEVLIAKGVLDGQDLVHVFGGDSAPDRGPSQA